MSTADIRIASVVAAQTRRERAISTALLAAASAFIALWPYTSVIAPGGWSLLTVTMIVIVVGCGLVVRLSRARRPDRPWVALIAQVIAIIVALTLIVAPQGALFGLIPTGITLDTFGRFAVTAMDEVRYGTAPLADSTALGAMVGCGFAIVALLIDQLISQRVALLTIVLVAVIGAMPMIITLGDANVPWFVMLAVLAMLLLRNSIRHSPREPRRASAGVGVAIGAMAIAAALAITPALPVSATWIGAGTSMQIDPSLRLGEDLRRPTPFTVMTLATKAESAPYLRVASLTEFDGDVWTPNESDTQPLNEGFGDLEWGEEIESVEQRTSVRVSGLSGELLPVPYAATKIVGLSSGWRVTPDDRTVASQRRDAAGQDYTVTSMSALPTRERIQAASTSPAGLDPEEEIPAVIAETARQVTAEAANDYDRLVALQTWFRSQFAYSLDAPVDGGFDGTGMDAVVAFLEAKTGYCIHFSGAFALMVQSLDMQVRIVVGYLPGHRTDDKRGSEFVYTVSSDQLHAWPEVHFEGIGWVPFEPTASLGTPTNFQPEATESGLGSTPTTTAPTSEPSSAPTTGPEIDRDQDPSATPGGSTLNRLDPTPVLLTVAGVIVALLLPGVVRLIVGARRRSSAHRGDAMSAWDELRDTLIDLGIAVSAADTPRARGAGVIARGADAASVGVLVNAVERASYAQRGADPQDLGVALSRVLADVRRPLDARTRVVARMLPRSLIVAKGVRAPVTV